MGDAVRDDRDGDKRSGPDRVGDSVPSGSWRGARRLPTIAPEQPTLCPSARPETPGSAVFGVVLGSADEPRVAYLREVVPATADILGLAGNVAPTEVFRFAAPCAESACVHFDGAKCSLAGRIVRHVRALEEPLPPCRLRPNCRWWQQEGPAACARCPLVVTDSYNASEALVRAATPPAEG